MQLKSLLARVGLGAGKRWEQRVADLEADVAEMRQHNVRLAEIADVVQELLIPMASRDEAAVQEAIERFRKSI